MWTVWPNSTKLSHIQQNTSHVKNPTEFLTPLFAENITCKISHWIYQTRGIRSNTSQMWTIRPNSSQLWYILHICGKNRSKSYKMWHIGQNTSHVKNPTEFLTPIFAENIKCKISDLIGQTWGILSNTSQMWTVWPNSTKLSHIQQNTSHVKNPTAFLTPIFADNVSCKILDRLC